MKLNIYNECQQNFVITCIDHAILFCMPRIRQKNSYRSKHDKRGQLIGCIDLYNINY